MSYLPLAAALALQEYPKKHRDRIRRELERFPSGAEVHSTARRLGVKPSPKRKK